MEHWWNDTDAVKQNYSQRNLLQCYFVHRKSHMDWPGIVPVLYLKAQPVPRSKHSVSVIKTNQSTLYREIIAVFIRSTQNT